MVEILEITGLVINILFIVSLIVAMVLGYFSGLWKKLRSVGGLFLGFALLLIFLTPLAKMVVNIDIPGEECTINEFLIETITKELENKEVILKGGELIQLSESITLSIAKLVVLLVGTTFVLAVIVPLNLIIWRLVLKKEERKPSIGFRFAGAGIAAVEVLVSFFFLMLPIYGVTTLVMSYEDVLKENENTKEIVESIEKIDNTIPNVLNKVFGKKMPTKALGKFTKVKNENGTINIFQELLEAKTVVTIVIESENKYDGDILKSVIANREDLIEYIQNTKIIETFMPAIIEIVEASASMENVNFDDIKNIDFEKDKKYLAEMLDAILILLEDANLDDPKSFLNNDNLPDSLKGIGEALQESTFGDIFLELIKTTIEEEVNKEDSIGDIMSILDITKIDKQNLPDDMYQIGVILNKIADMGLLDNQDIEYETEDLKELIESVFELSIIEGSEQDIFDFIIDIIDVEIDLLGIDFNKVISWEKEIDTLINLTEILTGDIDIANMTESEIENIVLIAVGTEEEPCYIASYLLGTAINTALESFLGEDAYLEFHNTHDLTDPKILKASVKDIVSVVNLSKTIVEKDNVEDWTEEEIEDFCDTLSSVDVKTEEVTVTILQEIVKDVEVDITKEDIQNADMAKESEVLKEILTAMKDGTSDSEIEELIEKAKEETTIIAALIEKYFR